ncbi:MAG TPA: hypothetical protein VIK04_00175 [Solirubrobacteraceae bacterium]
MRVRLVPRAARGAALVAAVTTAAAGCLATPALAASSTASSTISVTTNTTTPEQAVPVDLTFTGTNGSTGNAQVDAVVRPAGGLGCQGSYQEDVSTLGREDTTILAPAGQTLPPGAYRAYLICTWLEGPNTGEVDKTASTPITVGTPRLPAAPKPDLKLTTVRASRRAGVSVSGSTVSAFSGRVVVTAACGSARTKRTTMAKHGRFSARLGLPRGCRLGRAVKVSVSSAASRSWSAQSAGRSVTARA